MITLDGMKPIDVPSDGRFAPESCISLQDIPSADHVALVARDRSGRVRFRLEVENDERVIRWFTKALRFGLALFYGACNIQLVS